MAGELIQREQGTIHTWRGDFQGVIAADRIFDVQLGRHFAAHALAVIDVDDAIGLLGERHIDIQAQRCATRGRKIFDTQQFQTQGLNRWTQQIGDFGRFFAHRLP